MPKTYDGFNSFPPDAGIVCTEKGARQSELKACDINTIVKQYERSGQVPVTDLVGTFADVSAIGDFRGALEKIQAAQEKFMELPPAVRARFENDALAFVNFAVDPANRAQMVELGLLEPEKAPVAPVGPVGVPGGAPAAQ